MTRKSRTYRIGDLAALAGVSVRQLHHYDAVGLLKPASVAANGYRLYDRDDLLRLQEILFYRACGMSLGEIAEVMTGADRLHRLRAHREVLSRRAAAVARMAATLEAAIAEMEGGEAMADKALYEGISPARQAEYEAWLTERGHGAAVAHAKAGPPLADPADWAGVEAPLVAAYGAGVAAESPTLHQGLEAHRALVARFWRKDCPPAAYAGLADIYAHPDFVARYEALAAGFSKWLPQAMRAHAKRLEMAPGA